MYKNLIALLLTGGIAWAQVPPPAPATVADVLAGTATYKFISPAAAAGAGLSSPTNGVSATTVTNIVNGMRIDSTFNIGGNAAIGTNAGTLTQYGGIYLGSNNVLQTGAAGSILIGNDHNISGYVTGNGIKIGRAAGGVGDKGIAIGHGSLANTSTVGIGDESDAGGIRTVVVGASSYGNGNSNVVVGYNNDANTQDDIIMVGTWLPAPSVGHLMYLGSLTTTNTLISGRIHGNFNGATNLNPTTSLTAGAPSVNSVLTNKSGGPAGWFPISALPSGSGGFWVQTDSADAYTNLFGNRDEITGIYRVLTVGTNVGNNVQISDGITSFPNGMWIDAGAQEYFVGKISVGTSRGQFQLGSGAVSNLTATGVIYPPINNITGGISAGSITTPQLNVTSAIVTNIYTLLTNKLLSTDGNGKIVGEWNAPTNSAASNNIIRWTSATTTEFATPSAGGSSSTFNRQFTCIPNDGVTAALAAIIPTPDDRQYGYTFTVNGSQAVTNVIWYLTTGVNGSTVGFGIYDYATGNKMCSVSGLSSAIADQGVKTNAFSSGTVLTNGTYIFSWRGTSSSIQMRCAVSYGNNFAEMIPTSLLYYRADTAGGSTMTSTFGSHITSSSLNVPVVFLTP